MNENAFASIVQARPCPTFGRPVHQRDRPLDYGPVLLLKPSRFHLAVDTLSSGCPVGQNANLGTPLGCLHCFQFRARVGGSLSSFPGQRRVTAAFGYDAPHLSARGTLTLLIWALPSTHYVICRLAVEQKDITYLGSANPSTFHKLLETINARWEQIVADIEAGACAHLQELPEPAATTVRDRLKPNPGRAQELRGLFAGPEAADFTAIWPYLKLLTTWTRGSCAISLNSILPMFPPGMGVTDAGYLASELRGTVTIDAINAGLPTLQENFFEFVEKELWEGGNEVFLGLGDLEIGREYYLFVTTPAGLYRYDMNDIVEVTGIFQQTPTIAFVQKGKGATNITGEKLYESQIIVAMQRAEDQFALDVRHYQVLANEASSRYELYLELVSTLSNVGEQEVASYVDEALQEINIEYATKRGSDRLKQLVVTLLRQGTYERYKEHCLNSGRAEGQFKGVLLSYARDLDFDLERHRVPR